ncbi:MAG: hypothetical protein COB17_02270 [Sulfurimonas sp.]|nr:MAG: hypothetical protein COB17_02270 [Sulfurimonas sp.]
MKILFSILLLLLITGCGVSGKSGGSTFVVNSNNNSGNSIGNIDQNNGGDNNLTDGNITLPTDGNITLPGDNNIILPNLDDSIFDTTGDIQYDSNACNGNFYKTAADASYNGGLISENGSSFFNVENNGLQIRSEYLEASPSNAFKTFVTLFYKSFPTANDLGLQGSTSYVLEGFFSLLYDNAWVDNSISGIDNTVYIQSAQTTKPSCYRLILNSVTNQESNLQKVYR